MNSAQIRPQEKATLLLVSADNPAQKRLERLFAANGCRVGVAVGAGEALKALRQTDWHLVFLAADQAHLPRHAQGRGTHRWPGG